MPIDGSVVELGAYAEPAGVRHAAEERAGVQEQPAQQEHPEAVGVQTRERHVARPDHQRDQVVEERRRHRHHEQEDHRDAVHREDLVVLIGVQQRVVGLGQLAADQQRLEPADDEEEERDEPVHQSDLLVVHRGEPTPEAGERRWTPDPPGRGHGHAGHGAPIARGFAMRGFDVGIVIVITSGCTGRPPTHRSRPARGGSWASWRLVSPRRDLGARLRALPRWVSRRPGTYRSCTRRNTRAWGRRNATGWAPRCRRHRRRCGTPCTNLVRSTSGFRKISSPFSASGSVGGGWRQGLVFDPVIPCGGCQGHDAQLHAGRAADRRTPRTGPCRCPACRSRTGCGWSARA